MDLRNQGSREVFLSCRVIDVFFSNEECFRNHFVWAVLVSTYMTFKLKLGLFQSGTGPLIMFNLTDGKQMEYCFSPNIFCNL